MTLIEEMALAARGMLALLLGRRDAPRYFDLGLRGLAGSAVAFLLATLINAYTPYLLGLVPEEAGPAWQAVFMAIFLIGLQIGASALVLRQVGRMDGLVPYLVADNWATFFITFVSILLTLVGLGGDVVLLLIAVLVIVIEINIARLIVTLTPLQIAGFLIAQLVGVMAGLMVIGLLLGDPTAATSAATATQP